MASLTFIFNKEKVKESGKNIQSIMEPIKEYLYSVGAITQEERDDPQEKYEYDFHTQGDNSVTTLTYLVIELTKNDITFIDLLDKWELDSEGDIEDCIEETKAWYKRKGWI